MTTSSSFLDEINKIPPAARMVLPAAILALVSRQKHPVVWWLFGVLPMASAVAQAISEHRLFAAPAPAPVAPLRFDPSGEELMQ